MARNHNPYAQTMPISLSGLSRESSFRGPHGGGIKFYQMGVSDGFRTYPPISGHRQKQNISIPQPLRGFLLK